MYLCLSGYVIYDDGCHLKKFAQNPSRRDVTETAKRLSDVSIVVDKMHMKGHKDRWCKENCDARNIEDLKEVNIDEEEIMVYCNNASVNSSSAHPPPPPG